MARLKLMVWLSAAVVIACVLPALFLRIMGVGIPKQLAALAALGMASVPFPVMLFLIYFNMALGRSLRKAILVSSWRESVRTAMILCLCDSLLVYVLIKLIKAVWLN